MKRWRSWYVLLGIVVAAGILAAIGFHHDDHLQYFTSKVERGEIRDVVDATGTVNAVTTVQVGSQVSGSISKLNVDFNSRVHRGDIIAIIDASLLEGALQQANADVVSAKANVIAAEANLAKVRAGLVQARSDYDRNALLAKQGLEAQQTLELAKANFDAASASVDGAIANIAQAKAAVSQKEAAMSVARTNLDHTVIRSPIDGVVVARNVDVGQTVAASLQAPTIFTIAQDLTKMQVYAKTDESDVGHIKVGQQVMFKVDAFPADSFRGAVSQVRMNATMVQNVVTYDAIIDFANPAMKLFPGMTAYVTIPVATAQNALKLPNGALRYKPPMSPEDILKAYAKYGIDEKSVGRADRTSTGIVWKLDKDQTLEPVEVALGITDHAFTEVLRVPRGELKPGDDVVTGSLAAKAAGPAGQIRR